jgi:transcriptional regulator with XRE-family HTH domain
VPKAKPKKKQKPFAARFPKRASMALEALAENVRILRKIADFSQAALAAAIGVDQTEISKIENGRGNPSVILAERLAEALGVPLSDLFVPGARAKSSRKN